MPKEPRQYLIYDDDNIENGITRSRLQINSNDALTAALKELPSQRKKYTLKQVAAIALFLRRQPLLNSGTLYFEENRLVVKDPGTGREYIYKYDKPAITERPCSLCCVAVSIDTLIHPEEHEGSGICLPCVSRYYGTCFNCERTIRDTDLSEINTLTGYRMMCQTCCDNLFACCRNCDARVAKDSIVFLDIGGIPVPHCASCGVSSSPCTDCSKLVFNLHALTDRAIGIVRTIFCGSCTTKRREQRNNIQKDIMYTCRRCKKEVDPLKKGGVAVNETTNLCLDCYRRERAEKGTGFSGIYAYPKEDRDRKYREFEKRLAFFTDTADKYAHVGIEIETESGLWPRENELNDRILAVKRDGSISSWGMEMLTQPSSGMELVSTIRNVFGPLRRLGWSGSRATGMHNHVDFRDPKMEEVKKIFILGYILEPFIEAHIPKNRRNGQYCRSIRRLFTLEEILKIASNDSDRLFYSMSDGNVKKTLLDKDTVDSYKGDHHVSQRYAGLNIHSIFFRGTLEFRYPHTIIDATHALGFGLFFASMVEYVRSGQFTQDFFNPLVSTNLKERDIIKAMSVTPSMKLLKKYAPNFLA